MSKENKKISVQDVKENEAELQNSEEAYVLEVDKLVRNYKMSNQEGEKKEIQVLREVSFQVVPHEFVGIMGRSGCGKTTLLKTLGLIDKPTGGELRFKGTTTKYLWGDKLAEIRRNELGFVFQDFYLMDSLSVMENMMLPMILNQEDVKKMKAAAKEFAEQFGIAHLLDKAPYELSGGEKQRVAICRALINDPSVILADEPTGNLDSKSSRNVIDSLVRINEELGKTIILVTHDPIVASYCKKIIFLKDGQILETIVRENDREMFYQKIISKMAEL